jgi:hypothetical protein
MSSVKKIRVIRGYKEFPGGSGAGGATPSGVAIFPKYPTEYFGELELEVVLWLPSSIFGS